MTPLVVMVAPNGARRTKADHANLPITPAEIAREAERCCAGGATILHVHVRDDNDRHSLDPDLYRAAIVRALRPEAVSIALAELIPDEAATEQAAAFLHWLRRERIAPQYILYAPDEVTRFHELRGRGVIPQSRPFTLFVLGRYAERTQAQPRNLLPYLAAHDAECPWAVCAFGPREAACVLIAAGLGGHARVGFENNLWLADGGLAASNAQLVEQVSAGARLLGREVADVATTRALLAETAA
jgi:uncharacterized protein (DUF849 family)